MKKKEYKLTIDAEQIISIITSTITPAVFTLLAVTLIQKYNIQNENFWIAFFAVMGGIASLVFVIILSNTLFTSKLFRSFKNQEGRWLQIIPNMEKRPYAVLDLKFNKKDKRYELRGANFSEDTKVVVNFCSHQVIERISNDGFYYITGRTIKNTNGLGKVCFVESNYDKLTRAEGYFFDATDKECSKKYDFILIKCDKNLFEHIEHGENYYNVNEMPPDKIIDVCKDFLFEEKKRFCNQKKFLSMADDCCKCEKVHKKYNSHKVNKVNMISMP